MNETMLMEFVNKAVGDVGAVLAGSMVVIGDRLGLYRAMAGAGPMTSTELSTMTSTSERYVREWLGSRRPRPGTCCTAVTTATSSHPSTRFH